MKDPSDERSAVGVSVDYTVENTDELFLVSMRWLRSTGRTPLFLEQTPAASETLLTPSSSLPPTYPSLPNHTPSRQEVLLLEPARHET